MDGNDPPPPSTKPHADAHFNRAVTYTRQKIPKLDLARYHYQKALNLGAEPDKPLEALLETTTP